MVRFPAGKLPPALPSSRVLNWAKAIAFVLTALISQAAAGQNSPPAGSIVVGISAPSSTPDLGSERSATFVTKAAISNPSDSNGAFSYSYQLDVPPGIRGQTPALSLNYNSSSNLSSAGQGWKLDASSLLYRCESSKRLDHTSAAVAATDKDSLCLDGDRLVLEQGTRMTAGAVYRLERQARIRIVALAAPYDASKVAFRVDLPNGSHKFYGESAASALSFPSSSLTKSWGLNRWLDAYGNTVSYEYATNSDLGEMHVTTISYGPAAAPGRITANFSYQPETRRTSSIENGGLHEIGDLLTEIDILIDNNLVHKYRLSYSRSANRSLPLLTKVDHCGASGVCMTPVSLQWTPAGEPATITRPAVLTTGFHGTGTTRWLEDLNGDGLRDYVTKTSDGCIHWIIRTLTGWGPKQSQCGLHGIGSESWLIDINGDGLPDYVTKTPDTFIHWDLNTGQGYDSNSAFGSPQSQGNMHGVSASQWLTDINGDGLPDYVVKTNDGSLNWNLNQNGSWGPPITQTGLHGTGSARWLKDINGDGLPDYVAKTPDGNIHWDLNISDQGAPGKLFGPPVTQSGVHGIGSVRWLIDINGDGLPDYVAKNNDGTLHWNLNTGTGWGPSVSQDQLHGLGNAQWLADVDGDGLPDYIAKNGDGLIHWDRNLGRGYSTSQAFGPPQSEEIGVGLGADSWMVDVTGDGRADFVTLDNQGGAYVAAANAGQPIDLVAAITNQTGEKTAVLYSTTVAAGTTYRVTAGHRESNLAGEIVAFPIVVTESISRQVPGRQPWTTQYQYEDGRFDTIERRWLGFARIRAYDTFRQNILTREFSQTYPFEGLWQRETQLSSAGKPLLDRMATWGLNNDAGWGSYPVLNQMAVSSYTLEGALEHTTWQSNTYDALAQPVHIAQSADDHIGRDIDYTISNNTDAWLLGVVADRVETLTSMSGVKAVTVTNTVNNFNGDPTAVHNTPQGAASFDVFLTYYPNGLIKSKSISSGSATRLWSYGYDAAGNVTSRKSPIGQIDQMTFDPRFGLQTSAMRGSILIESSKYDDFGNQVSTFRSSGNNTTRYFDLTPPSGGFSIKVISSNGAQKTETYDAAGMLTRVEALGFGGNVVTTNYAYDAVGRLFTESLPTFAGDTPHTYSLSYDALDRETRRDTPWGEVIETKYDARGHSISSGGVQRTRFTYDSSGQFLSIIEQGGTRLVVERDANASVRKAIVGSDLFATFATDGAGRLISSLEPGRGSRSYAWDAFGDLRTEITPSNIAIKSVYDNSSRRLSRSTPPATSRSWSYDKTQRGIGSLSERRSSDGIQDALDYDDAGRVSTEVRSFKTSKYRFGRNYDRGGRLSDLILPGNLPNLHYTYDQQGDLLNISVAPSGAVIWTAVERDAAGRLVREAAGANLEIRTGYEPGRQAISSLQVHRSDGTSPVDLSWSRDFHGNVTSIFDNGRSVTSSLTYDNADRVQTLSTTNNFGIDALSSFSVTYNLFGDILTKSGRVYEYNPAPAGRLLTSVNSPRAPPSSTVDVDHFNYDMAGNTLLDGVRNYRYNKLGAISRIEQLSTGVSCSYLYDGNDEVAVKRCDAAAASGSSIEEHYLSKSFTRTFSHGMRQDRYLVYAGAKLVAVLFGKQVPVTQQAERHPSPGIPYRILYPVTDDVGSLLALLDGDGKLVAEYRYAPFGERATIYAAAPALKSFPLGFQGQPTEGEFELLRIGARFYNPVIGRFITPDLATDLTTSAQATNRYAFALNNPLRFTDSSGLYIDKDGNEFAGPPDPNPEHRQYENREARDHGAAGVHGYDNPQEGRYYSYEHGKVKEISDRSLERPVLDPIDILTLGGPSLVTKGVSLIKASFTQEVIAAGELAEKYLEKEGIYIFEAASGRTYVGQSGNVGQRLLQHVESGKLPLENLSRVEVVEVNGGKTAREIAEQLKINELGGIRDLENVRNPIGPERQHLIQEFLMRPRSQ